MAKMKALLVAALFGTTLCAPVPLAQTLDKPVFHAESDQVLVPTFVLDRALIVSANPREITNQEFENYQIRNLIPKDFRVFEDGKEQKIQSVTTEWVRLLLIHDNVGQYNQYSETPRGRWSTSDLERTIGEVHRFLLYRIAYVPPPSAVGSCHQIEVKVDRHNAFVYARSEYCNTQHSPFDPLNGTKLGRQMESDASSERAPKIALSLQASVFRTETDAARVNLSVDFPWNSLNRESSLAAGDMISFLTANIGILGLIYGKDGALAARFSDFACCSPELPVFSVGGSPPQPHHELDNRTIPNRYETQIDLPPGEYKLVVVLSDGSKFGRVEAPLTVESYDRKQLGISSVELCKRFHEAVMISPETAAIIPAPDLVPLVSKGVEFSPASDTRFKRRTAFNKGEALFAYFELYEPLLVTQPAATVQSQLKITNVKTGELKVDTGARSAVPWIQPGSSVIRIAEEVSVEKLPTGSYRLEVQASDSAGKSTVWRAAEFTVE